MRFSGLQKQTRLRLPAITRVSLMRTAEDPQKRHTLPVQFGNQVGLYLVKRLLRHDPASHTPLVRCDGHRVSVRNRDARRIDKLRHQVKIFPALHIPRTGGDIHDPIAVKEHTFLLH